MEVLKIKRFWSILAISAMLMATGLALNADAQQEGNVLISEVFYESSGPDSETEYIELFNPFDTEADLEGWTLTDNSDSLDLDGVTIPPYSYYLLARSRDGPMARWGIEPDMVMSGISLDNDGDVVKLEKGGELVDLVAWENGEDGTYVSWDIEADRDRSVRRQDVYDTTSTADVWYSMARPDPKNRVMGTGEIDLEPTAFIEVSEETIHQGENIILDAEDSYDPENDGLAYVWNIRGTDQEKEGQMVTATFPNPGLFRIELKVTDPSGLSDTDSQEVRVVEVEDVIEDQPGEGEPTTPRLDTGQGGRDTEKSDDIDEEEDRTNSILAAVLVVLAFLLLIFLIGVIVSLRRR